MLGTELIGYGLVVAGVTARLQTNTLRRLSTEDRRRWLLRDMTYNVGVLAIVAAGVGLLVGRLGGLYWLVITTVLFFLWSSLQAWWLLIEEP